MKCPECGVEMKKGEIKAKDAGSITQSSTMLTWFPEGDKKKISNKDAVNLQLNGEGYYCDECMKVYAMFEKRYELF